MYFANQEISNHQQRHKLLKMQDVCPELVVDVVTEADVVAEADVVVSGEDHVESRC